MKERRRGVAVKRGHVEWDRGNVFIFLSMMDADGNDQRRDKPMRKKLPDHVPGYRSGGARPQQEPTCERSVGRSSFLLLPYFQQRSEGRHQVRIRLRGGMGGLRKEGRTTEKSTESE